MSAVSRPTVHTCGLCGGENIELLCARCRDHAQAVNEYVQLGSALDSLEREGKVDEALALLDHFLQANLHRDRNQWLARQAISTRQSLLYFADRNIEALRASEDAEKLGFANVAERWAHGRSKALVLESLGKPDEALRTFEEAFQDQDPSYDDCAPYFFHALVQFYTKAGKPVDPQWLSVAEAAAKRYALDVPICDTIAETLLAVAELTRGRKPQKKDAALIQE